MPSEKFLKYFEILEVNIKNKNIKYNWSNGGFSIQGKKEIPELLKDYDINNEEFLEFVFEVGVLTIDISHKNFKEHEQWKVELVKEKLFSKIELDHIALITSSNLNFVTDLNCEVITKSKKKNEGFERLTSILMSIESNNKKEVFELSEKQVLEMIELLNEQLTHLETLKEQR